MNKTLFFALSGGLLLFSIIVVNIAPSGLVNNGWDTDSCKAKADTYKYAKDNKANEDTLKFYKKDKNRCERRQAMIGLEYTALNVNIVCGFVCTLLGFLFFFNIGDVGKIASYCGLGTGAVGFVLTLVYVIESGLVFTDIEDNNYFRPRIASDGSFAEWDSSKNAYTCKFYNEKDSDSVKLRYSNYGNKYLNYKKDIKFYDKENNYEYHYCKNSGFDFFECKDRKEGLKSDVQRYQYSDANGNLKDCNKLYYVEETTLNYYKNIYDRWLTTIILSCFIFLLDIGVALFGFLLSRDSKGTGI